MSRTATHNGNCQICGATQALPNGVLSLHGYAVQWSSFVGICPGAKHLPFEQDKSRAERHVADVLGQAAHLDEEASKLRHAAVINGAIWVHEYVRSTRDGKSDYRWRQVTIDTDTVNDYPVFSYVGLDGKRNRIEGYNHGYAKTFEALGRSLNDKRADALDRDAANLRRYIAWQVERCAAWTPKPLTPRKAEARKGPMLHAMNRKHELFTVCGSRRRSLYGNTTKHCAADLTQVTCPKCAAKLAEVGA